MLTRLQAPPYDALAPRLARGVPDPTTESAVRAILDDVRARGDDAVREHTRLLDHVDLPPETWEVPGVRCQEALDRIPTPLRAALELAASRILDYHTHQIERGFTDRDGAGDGATTEIGMRVVPLERVGVYVPGGKAAYPSTVLMSVIPAAVAGVTDIVMVTPPGQGGPSDAVLAAARLAGVHRIFQVGGAQAIGALAWGTGTVPRVDKIVGPGNKYVAEAKRQVSGVGTVGIDMLAGPTEVMVIADDGADPRHAAADLLAQAEHDEDARVWLVTTSARLADAVDAELEHRLAAAPRRAIAGPALAAHGVAVIVPSLEAAVQVANRCAPEHLELLVARPWSLVEEIRHAGAVFLGPYTPEPVGDYLAGPSHVLPTGGAARYVSPLGVYDFVKRISVIAYSRARLAADAPHLIALAEAEGLAAHADAVRARLED